MSNLPPKVDMDQLTANRAKIIPPPNSVRQLFNHYPVPEGCPGCGTIMHLLPSQQQLQGTENLQISVCPNDECKISLEFVIGKYTASGKFKPADVKYLKPDGDVMKAFKTNIKVLLVPKNLTN